MKEIVILSTVLILLPLCASGTIYYADAKNGDNSNDGDGISSAFATIKPCIEALRNPGDECHIRSGRYHQSEFHISDKHGYADQPMIIRGYQNEIPELLMEQLRWSLKLVGNLEKMEFTVAK